MGLDFLKKYKGKICFFCPADIQFVSGNDDLPSIRLYCQELLEALGNNNGGFMYKAYSQPSAVEISYDALVSEAEAFAGHRYRRS